MNAPHISSLLGPILTRRRFMQAAAAAGALSFVPWPLRTALAAPSRAPVLSGTEFALEIGAVPLTINGRQATATGVNGLVPAPTLRWRQGDTLTLAVTNRLSEPSSIHWHGVRTPSPMDGVPGLSFRGVMPGETFVYRFPVHQSGTYWYHSHSMFQEQTGLYGAIVIEPRGGYVQAFDRDYVVLLSDWSFEKPETIVSNLKFQSDYYNYGRRTLGTFVEDAQRKGLADTVADRLEWGKMRMSPTDILDVSGATYTYLINGQAPGANWTALFRPGERVRLRFINGSSMSIFDVRIPDLPMTVIQADGNDVAPVTVDEFRISVAETYDVIVRPTVDRAYTIFTQAEDRTGFARGTLAPRPGMAAPIPPMDPRPMRTMADMGVGSMEQGSMSGMKIDQGSMPGMDHAAMPGMNHGSTPDTQMDHGSMAGMSAMEASPEAKKLQGRVGVDNVAMMPTERLQSAGEGFPPGRRVLTYADLRAINPGSDPRPPTHEITLHLTGNMERFVWGFDGKKFSEAGRSSSNAATGCASCSSTTR
jgi:CopA family copper-resistance protein